MKLRSLPAALLPLLLALSGVTALAQPLVQNTSGLAYSTSLFTGQSFLTPNDGTADLMTAFTWLDLSNAPMGAGSVYVFDQEYLGAPTSLASGAGLLATSNPYLAGSYSFGPGVVLNPNTQYWVYTSTAQQVGITIGDAYPGGTYYTSSGSGVAFASGGTGFDATFAVTASAIPEPSTYVALAGLLALGAAAWRRRARLIRAA